MGQSEPELRIRTLALVVLPLVASPLASKFRVPRSVQPPHGKLRPPLVPDAAPPVNRYRRSLSRGNNNSAVLDIVQILSTLHQWFPCGPLLACHLTWYSRPFPSAFTTLPFGQSRRRWFGTCSCKPVPRGLPSSIKQLRTSSALRLFVVLVAHYCRYIGQVLSRYSNPSNPQAIPAIMIARFASVQTYWNRTPHGLRIWCRNKYIGLAASNCW